MSFKDLTTRAVALLKSKPAKKSKMKPEEKATDSDPAKGQSDPKTP